MIPRISSMERIIFVLRNTVLDVSPRRMQTSRPRKEHGRAVSVTKDREAKINEFAQTDRHCLLANG